MMPITGGHECQSVIDMNDCCSLCQQLLPTPPSHAQDLLPPIPRRYHIQARSPILCPSTWSVFSVSTNRAHLYAHSALHSCVLPTAFMRTAFVRTAFMRTAYCTILPKTCAITCPNPVPCTFLRLQDAVFELAQATPNEAGRLFGAFFVKVTPDLSMSVIQRVSL